MSTKASEADDVLDFLNSLPEDTAYDATTNAKPSTKDDDLLGFLDELAAGNTQKGNLVESPSNTVESPSNTVKSPSNTVESPSNTVESPQDVVKSSPDVVKSSPETVNPPLEIDPLGTLSSWWSSGASSKVSSLWGTASAKAEEAFSKLDLNAHEERLTQAIQEVALNTKAHNTIDSLSKNFNRFTDALTTLATGGEPIEALKIRLVHDIKNYHYIDEMVERNFRRVMSQVEGGVGVTVQGASAPREEPQLQVRNLNIFRGKISDGEKLAFANLDQVIKQDTAQDAMGADGVKRSDLYIALQPISVPASGIDDSGVVTIDSFAANSFAFTIVLKDISHDITVITRTQPFPIQWAEWLDGKEEAEASETKPETERIDPAEWVEEWVYDGLNLGLGVVAQSYVVKRMGF